MLMRRDYDLLKPPRSLISLFYKPAIWVVVVFFIFMVGDASAHSIHQDTAQSIQIHKSVSIEKIRLLNPYDLLINKSGEINPFCCHTDDIGVACSSGLTSFFAKDILLVRLYRGTKIKLTRTSLQLGVTRAPPFRPPIL